MEIKRRYIDLFLSLENCRNGLLGYTISNRFDLTPSDVIAFIMEYQKKCFITCDDEYRIKITEAGRAAIDSLYENGVVTEYTHGSKYFEGMRMENRLKINEPYLPTKDFLNTGKKNNGGENVGN